MSNFIRVTLDFTSVDELNAFFASRGNQTVADAVAAEGKETPKPRKPKPAETPAAAPAAAPAVEQPSPESSAKETKPETPPAEDKPADTAPQLSYAEDIQKPVMALVSLNQAGKIKEILDALGVASLKGSDPAIWPAAKAKLDAALAAAKAEAELA